MSVEDDWKDLARGAALREWGECSWSTSSGDEFETGIELEQSDDNFAGSFIRHAFIRGYTMGFLAAKKRDVVTVDPYKVEVK